MPDAWADLQRALDDPAGAAPFEPEGLGGLPEPAQRWLCHAIPDGRPLSRGVRLRMRGRIRVGRWLPFRADQILVPARGFVWRSRVGWGPLGLRGADTYHLGRGSVRFALLGLVPVVSQQGPDIDRSAAGRLAIESVLCPTALVGNPAVGWDEAGDDRFVVRIEVDGREHAVLVVVDGAGRLREATMDRWGDPDGDGFGEHPFGIRADAVSTFGGVTIPSVGAVGWGYGTDRWADGEFFRFTIDDARFPDSSRASTA